MTGSINGRQFWAGLRAGLPALWAGLAVLLIATGGERALAQPANDNFTNAAPIPAAVGSINGCNINATYEPGEPSEYNNVFPTFYSHSVWFSWTATTNGTATIDTFGSYYLSYYYYWLYYSGGYYYFLDTALAVYSGTNFNNLSLVAANDNYFALGYGTLDSLVSFQAVAGTTYYIQLDGLYGDMGFYRLNWTLPNGPATSGPIVAPIGGNEVRFASVEVPVDENTPGYATVKVEYGGAIPAPVTVDYATGDGSAVAGLDYLSRSGTLTFPPGVTNQEITIPILDNALQDGMRNFTVSLLNPSLGLALGIPQTTVVTIRDDDFQLSESRAGEFNFTITNYIATEFESVSFNEQLYGNPQPPFANNYRNTPGALVTVTRTGGSRGRVMVDYSTFNNFFASSTLCSNVTIFGTNAGTSTTNYNIYQDVSGTLVFDDYQMSASFIVPINPIFSTNSYYFFNPYYGVFNYGSATLMLTNARPALEEDPTLIRPTIGATNTSTLTIANTWRYSYYSITNTAAYNTYSFERINYRVDEYQENGRDRQITIRVMRPFGGCGNCAAFIELGRNTLSATDLRPFPLSAGSDYAIPGVDFDVPGITNNPGEIIEVVLPFGDNTVARTFNIRILDDSLVEFNEDITMRLVSGYHPYTRYATVTILSDEQPPGALDREWNPDGVSYSIPPFNFTRGANNEVRAVAVQPGDLKTLLGGDFTAVNSVPRNFLARLNRDGSLDTSFLAPPNTGADGYINVILPYPTNSPNAGKIVVGGGFTSFNGAQRNSIARLNADGTVDPTFNPGTGADGPLRAMLLLPDERLVIAGDFLMYNDINRSGMARLNPDGALDQSFDVGAGPDGRVWSLALVTNAFGPERILVAGEFMFFNGTYYGGVVQLNNAGALDPSFDPGGGADGPIYAATVQTNGFILIAGSFSEVALQPRNNIARLNPEGAVDATFNPGSGANSAIYAMTLAPDGRPYIGGLFSSYNGTRRVGLAKLKENGTLDTYFMDTAYNQFAGFINTFSFQPPNFINSIALESEVNSLKLIVGGSFTNLGGNQPFELQDNNSPSPVWTRADKRGRYNLARLIGDWGTTDRPVISTNIVAGTNVVVTNMVTFANPVQGPGNAQFAYPDYSVDENAGSLAVTLRRVDGRLGTLGAAAATLEGQATPDVDFLMATNSVEWGQHAGFMFSDGDTNLNYTNLTVQLLDDPGLEGNETVNLQLSNPYGYVTLGGEYIPLGGALGPAAGQLTIVDNDFRPGVFTFSAPSYITNEDAVRAYINVYRTNGSSGAVSVDYYTQDGTARVGSDYSISRGTLTFGQGVTNRSFFVTIANDLTVEFDETIVLLLTNAAGGATLPGGQPTSTLTSTLTIVDNDFLPGRLNFSANVYTNNEADGAATVTVTRGGGNVGNVSLGYTTVAAGSTAIVGRDYTPVSGVLTWPDGDSTPRVFTVPLALDGMVDGTRSVKLAITNANPAGAAGGRTNAMLYVEDADAFGQLAFSQSLFVADENGSNVTITVVRSGGIAGTVSVAYATSPNTARPGAGGDYLDTSGLLVFLPNELSKSFRVTLLDDADEDGNKDLTLALSNPTNATLGAVREATLTVVDNESYNTPAGQLDTTFTPNAQANDAVFALALQGDGRILMAGNFTNVNLFPRYRIARLLSDGNIDTSFNVGSGPNGPVRSLALQPDNKMLIGGFFTEVNGINRKSVARLNIDGLVDNSFNPGAGADNPVYVVCLQPDGKVLLGGSFSSFNGVTRPGLVRLDASGRLDPSFNAGAGANGVVYAVALQPNGQILVGGDFNAFNGQSNLHHLVRLNLNGSVDTSFAGGAGFDGPVQAILVQPDGKVVVGGSFMSFGGVARRSLARLDQNGALDAGFLAGEAGGDQSVYAIAQQVDGRLVVAGDFTLFNGVTRNRLTRLNADGSTDPSINFGTGANSFVGSVVIQPDRKMVIAGGFTEYNGQPRRRIARIHGGSVFGSGSIEFNTPVFTVNENETNALVTLRRLGGTSGQVSVDYATGAGSALAYTNYLPTNGTLLFPQGETQARFVVPLVDDHELQPDRIVNLILSNFVGAVPGPQPVAVLQIREDESQLTFAAANYSVGESIYSGKATISVLRAGATNGEVQVSFQVTDGTATSSQDYTATNGNLVFLPGETAKNFIVPILADNGIEGNETVNLVITNPTPTSVLFGLSNAVLSIVDDDFGPGQVGFAAAIYTVDENDPAGKGEVTVVRTNGTTGVISVRYSTYQDTNTPSQAVPGQDYAPTTGILTFADSETVKTFTVGIINDTRRDSNQVVLLRLSNPTGGASLQATNATLTIVDDEYRPGILSFSTNNFLVTENNSQAQIQILRTRGTTDAVSVRLTTADGSAMAGRDYLGTNVVVTFASGQSSVFVPLALIGNVQPNFDRTFRLQLSDATQGAALDNPAAATVTIQDDDHDFAGAVDLGFNAAFGADGPVYALCWGRDDGLYVGGNFTSINGAGINRIAKMTTNAVVDLLSFNPGNGASSNVNAIVEAADGSVFVGGDFTNVNSLVRSRVARLNTNGTVNLNFDPGVGPNGTVHALALSAPPTYSIIRDSAGTGSSDTYQTNIGATSASVQLTFSGLPTETNSLVITSVDTNGFNVATLLNTSLTQSTVISLSYTGAPSTIVAIAVNAGLTNTNAWSYSATIQSGLPGDQLIVMGGAFTAVGATAQRFVARLDSSGAVDPTFTQVGSGLNGRVLAIAGLTNGQFIIGGDFTNANNVAMNRIARLNQNGNIDVSFNPGLGADGSIRSISVQRDGRIVIGGSFTNVDGAPRHGVARLNPDGSLDVTFDPGTGGSDYVSAVLVQGDGNILVVGAFTNFNGQPFNRVVRLNTDGTIDPSFNPGTGANDVIHALAALRERPAASTNGGGTNVLGANTLATIRPPQPKIVGGAPTQIANYPYQVALIRVPNNPTNIYNDQFCGGSILSDRWIVTAAHCLAGELPATVAAVVGVTDLANPAGARVFGVDNIILHPAYDPLTYRNDIALMHLTESISFGTTNYAAATIRPANQLDLAAGLTDPGVFATITGWGNTSGGLIPNYPNILQVAAAPITDVSNYQPGQITPEMIMAGYPAGGVDTCQGDSGGPMVVTNGSTGELILAGVTSWGNGCAQPGYPGVYTRVSAFNSWIASQTQDTSTTGPRSIAIGGQFTLVNGFPRYRVALLDGNGAVDQGFDPGAASHTTVYALGVYTNRAQPALFGKVVVGGDYLALAGISANSIARLNTNGVVDRSFDVGRGANGAVRAVAIQTNGQVVIGGLFTQVNSTNRGRLARLNEDGSIDPLYNAGLGLNNAVYAIAMQPDQRMVIGGAFTAVGAVSRNFIARMITNGAPDLTFDAGLGPDGAVRAIAVQPDGRIVIGGDFTTVAGEPRNHVARLHPDGSLDSSFDPGIGPAGPVYTLVLQPDGRVVIGGAFATVGGVPINRIARLYGDGTLDPTFYPGSGPNDYVSSIALEADGGLLVGGGFTAVNGQARNRLARLLPDGSTDPGINFGSGANNFIAVVVWQAFDGNILVGGGFTAFNDVPRNAIARITGGIISPEDAAGSLQFSLADFRVPENSSNAVITILRERGLLGSVSVAFSTGGGTAVPGRDYLPVSTLLTFAPGEIMKTVAVPLVDNLATNVDRMVRLTLATPTGGATLGNPSPATLTLLDNDTVLGFSASSFVVDETSPSARITITRAGGTVERVTVDYTTTNGTAVAGVNYFDVVGTLTFNPGVTAQSFSVPITNDLVYTGNRTVLLSLFNATGPASLGRTNATLTLLEADTSPGTLGFATNLFTINEGEGTATVTVTRTNGTTGVVSANYATANGSALVGADYVEATGVVTLGEGETNKTFTLQILDDKIPEGTETVQLTLSNPTGGAALGRNAALLAILDDDGPGNLAFETVASYVSESAGVATGRVVRLGGTNGVVSVQLQAIGGTAAPGADYGVLSTNVLVFAAGQRTNTFTIPILNDGLVEGSETISLQLSNATGGAVIGSPAVSTMTILDDELQMEFTTPVFTVSEGSTFASLSVVRSGNTSNDAYVSFSSTDGTAIGNFQGQYLDYVPTNGTLHFVPGETNKTLLVRLVDDSLVEPLEYFSVILFDPINGSLGALPVAQVNIQENDVGFSFAAPNFLGAEASNVVISNLSGVVTGAFVTISVIRVGDTNMAGTVDFQVGDGTATVTNDYLNTNLVMTLVYAPGQISNSFALFIVDDQAVEGPESVNLGLFNPSAGAVLGAQPTATLTILDNDTSFSFSAANYLIGEKGGTAWVTVVRSGVSTGAVSVTLTTSNGTATAGADYASVSNILVWGPADLWSTNVPIRVYDDALLEGSETVVVRLSAPGGGAFVASGQETAILTIVDNAGSIAFDRSSYQVAENGGAAVVTLVRTGGTNGAVTVDLQVTSGTAQAGVDFLAPTSTVAFAQGETTRTVLVPILDDGSIEGAETLTLRLSKPTAGALLGVPNLATLTLYDNEADIVGAGTTFAAGGDPNGNGVVDPSESVNMFFYLRNAGSVDLALPSVSLVPTPGITPLSGPANYGVLTAGGTSVARAFRFTATGATGETVTARLQFTIGGNTNSATFNLVLGSGTNSVNNANLISITDNSVASPYPATINIAGMNGLVKKVTVTLFGLTHSFPEDVDMALVSPDGKAVMLMSDVGGGIDINNLTLTFDDAAPAALGTGRITNGTYRPSNIGSADAPFPAPAPAMPYAATLSHFTDSDPNGTWSLYVLDDSQFDGGSIVSGWRLNISTTAPVGSEADVALSASTSATQVNPGDLLAWFVSVTNFGPSEAYGVFVTNTLPAGVDLVSAFTTKGSCSVYGSDVVCDLSLLATNSGGRITLNVRPASLGAVSLSSRAVSAQADPNPLNNSSSAAATLTWVGPVAYLTTRAVASTDQVAPGQAFAWLVGVTNFGPAWATNVALVSALPAGVILNGVTNNAGSCVVQGTNVICTLSALPPGAELQVELTVTPTMLGTQTVTASAQATTGDPNPADNAAFSSVLVRYVADLSLRMAVSAPQVQPGGVVTCFVAVTNRGPSDATGVVVTNTLPPGVILLATNTTRGSCSVAGGRVICNLFGLAVNNGALITLTVSPTNVGSITFQSQAGALESDLVPGDNVGAVSVSVGTSAGPILSAALAANGQPVFTLHGQPGQTYVIEAASEVSGAWLPVGTNVLTSATMSFTDPAAGTQPRRFYRAFWRP